MKSKIKGGFATNKILAPYLGWHKKATRIVEQGTNRKFKTGLLVYSLGWFEKDDKNNCGGSTESLKLDYWCTV